MKKKLQKSAALSDEPLPGQPAADYVVGQVSGSLFPETASASGSLSALFSTAKPATSLLFQPAPKPVKKSPEPQEETLEVKGEPGQKKRQKPNKEKSEADQKLENREMSLQNADEDERAPAKKKKKKKEEKEEEKEEVQRGRENTAEQWVKKRQMLKSRKAEEAVKRSRTIFVGNLPISCSRKTLQKLFKDTGSIESVRFRSLVREDPSMSRKVAVIQRKLHPKRQSMNAYVVFKEDGAVAKALERNGMEIEKDFHIRVDRVTNDSSYDHKRCVFVGNLSFEMNELAFRRHFEECGVVEAVRMVRDQNSGLGKGFGYVLFESADSVQLALELDGSKLEGRSIRVKRSESQKKRNANTNANAKAKGKGSAPERGGVRGGFRSGKKFSGNQQRSAKSSASFKGEMTDPVKKSKKKGLKKKPKPKKTVHI